jgi:hypothetical protein
MKRLSGQLFERGVTGNKVLQHPFVKAGVKLPEKSPGVPEKIKDAHRKFNGGVRAHLMKSRVNLCAGAQDGFKRE